MTTDDDKPARKRNPQRTEPRNDVQLEYQLDDKTARTLRAAARSFNVDPDELLWLLVRYGLKP